MKRAIKRIVVTLIVLGLAGWGATWFFQRGKGQPPSYRTDQVTRGELLVSISASGTVEPEEVIDVGARVAGQILSFGKDADGKTVDYGSVVEAGTILARLDDLLYSADAAHAEAEIQAAKAGLQRAEAELEQMKAKLHQAERDWNRAQKLGPSEALAEATYDAYHSSYETAKANVVVAEATILQAHASIAQAEAVLKRAQRNLDYCTIKSPVKGVIIDRRVNIGQTVVASLNAPSLFLIAKDLKRMQVWVAVNEADIGRIYPGQPVTFTVDAFPGETFQGEVGKVRLNASMTQNVVTYTVEIVTDNKNGRLLPYLTANVKFELNRIQDTLLIPNTSLRWTPSPAQVAPDFRNANDTRFSGEEPSGDKRRALRVAAAAEGGQREGVVWVPEGPYVRPLKVVPGPSDGLVTSVEGEGLNEGVVVVTGLESEGSGESDASNPFAPQFRRGGRSGGRR